MVDTKFVNSDIATEEMLTHTAKQAEEGSQSRPQPFNGVGVNLTHAIAIIITRPLLDAMRHRRSRTLDHVVTVVFVGVNMRAFAGKLLDMLAQRRLV